MDTRAEEAASQAASDVEAAKEEALKQMEVNAASLEAGIERANSAIEKLPEAKQSVRPPVLAGWLVGWLAACLPSCLPACLSGWLAGWLAKAAFFLLTRVPLPPGVAGRAVCRHWRRVPLGEHEAVWLLRVRFVLRISYVRRRL